jgi:hypothetical protein
VGRLTLPRGAGRDRRRHVLGEAADRDAVDAGFGDGAHALEVDAAGGFELGAALVDGDGFAHLVEAHVVEQDHLGAGGEGFFELAEVLDLDFDEHVGRGDGAGVFDHRLDAAGGDDVVFLDQDAVVEADAVVGAAADAHRVFLRQAQAGQGLAGVDDLGRCRPRPARRWRSWWRCRTAAARS